MDSKELFESFRDMKVLVIGDLMVDQYFWGSIDRISPEAPVPVLSLSGKEKRLGGAANVALNVLNLDAQLVVCGVVGKDENGSFLMDHFESLGVKDLGILQSSKRKTTLKTRVVAGRHQMLRIDHEQCNDLEKDEELRILTILDDLFTRHTFDTVIIQDYNKGLLTDNVIDFVLKNAKKQKAVIGVDPKNFRFYKYKEVDLFKPNFKEVKENVPIKVQLTLQSLDETANYIKNRLNHRFTMITLSDDGLYFCEQHNGKIFKTRKRTVADVCGAGDAVIAISSLCLTAGMPKEEIALASNIAGGQVCEKVGVVPLDKDQVLSELTKKVIV